MSFQLWGRPTSARTQKVMLALAELKIDYDFVMASATMGPNGSVRKGNAPFGLVKTVEYLDKNPNGTIPTIDDNGYVLWESNAIVQYLGLKYNPSLFFNDNVKTFCSASRWMMWENNNLIPPMHTLSEHLFRLPANLRNRTTISNAKEQLIREFSIVEYQLSKTSFIAGEEWSMGDIPLTIRCHRWHLLVETLPKMPNLERYYKSVQLRPSFETIRNTDLHTAG